VHPPGEECPLDLPQELQAKLRTVVFDRRTWELRRAKDQAHLHQYYVRDHEIAPVHDDRRAHVRGRHPGQQMQCSATGLVILEAA